jgi:hypothetical protein
MSNNKHITYTELNNRDEILTKIYTDKIINKLIIQNRIYFTNEAITEELQGELILQLCSLPEDRIVDMWNKKQLINYILKMIWNMLGDTSTFGRRILQWENKRITITEELNK